MLIGYKYRGKDIKIAVFLAHTPIFYGVTDRLIVFFKNNYESNSFQVKERVSGARMTNLLNFT